MNKDEVREDDRCICGHTRNYHSQGWWNTGSCRMEVNVTVGNMVYREACACQRFGELRLQECVHEP